MPKKPHLLKTASCKVTVYGLAKEYVCKTWVWVLFTVVSGGRSLRLMHAATEDAGRYTCIVSNTAGEDRKNFNLDVLGNSTRCMLCTILLEIVCRLVS